MFWFSWAKSNTGHFFPIFPRRWALTDADPRRFSPISAERIILTGVPRGIAKDSKIVPASEGRELIHPYGE
jgi:hypothetical protein